MTLGEPVPASVLRGLPVTDVGVIDKAASVLKLLMSASMTSAEIYTAVGLSRSTGYRLLAALAAHGFIVRTATGHFTLGPFPRRDGLSEVTAVLTRLRDRTGESAQLWLLNGDVRSCVAAVDSKQDLRIAKSAGTSLQMRDGGSGAHALLAAGSPSELFITRGARVEGSGSAAIAFGVDGDRRLAVCVSFPLARMTHVESRKLGAPLSDAARVLMEIVPASGAGDALEVIASGARVE